MHNFDDKTVVIDGNDGTGKSTLVASLRARGFRVQDRGLPTTLTDYAEKVPMCPREKYIILDAPVPVCQRRLVQAGKNVLDKYHTEEDLTHYRSRFQDIAQYLRCEMVDSSGSQEDTLGEVLAIMGERLPQSWDDLDEEGFKKLPLIIEGESKIVRDAGGGRCLIKFKPTVYSFTKNRAGEVPGTDAVRMRICKILVGVLVEAYSRFPFITHAYRTFGDNYVIAARVNPPPIEVIVKHRHVGTPKHRYFGMLGTRKRDGLAVTEGYPEPVVRFDWRNPNTNPCSAERMSDEPLCDEQAEWFIDTTMARAVAKKTDQILAGFLKAHGVELVDMCLMITADGKSIFGELSPDCMRVRGVGKPLDKDVWRNGGSGDATLEAWQRFESLLTPR